MMGNYEWLQTVFKLVAAAGSAVVGSIWLFNHIDNKLEKVEKKFETRETKMYDNVHLEMQKLEDKINAQTKMMVEVVKEVSEMKGMLRTTFHDK
jgi:hypothetical protein